jgi:hypothetical protein
MDINIICINCKHLLEQGDDIKCKAFPNGIPELIATGESDHSKPLKGQKNNIVFEKLEANN